MIRVQIVLSTDGLDGVMIQAIPPFFIDPMPFTPRQGEFFDLSTVLHNVWVPGEVYNLKWRVNEVEWKRDKVSYFIKVVLFGEQDPCLPE